MKQKKKSTETPEKKPEKTKKTEPRKDKGKIYKTTDGFFNGKKVKKPRRVAVVHQRKDDGAVAVVKIYGKKNKDTTAKQYVQNLVLDPEDHSSLTEPSLVGSRVLVGRKEEGEQRAIYPEQFNETDDKLTKKEKRTIKKGVEKSTPQHHKTYKNTIKKWKKHFK